MNKVPNRYSQLNISDKLQCEYGTCSGVRFLNPSHVKMYDSEGKEVCIPKCDKCGYHKSQVIDLNSFTWICSCCGG